MVLYTRAAGGGLSVRFQLDSQVCADVAVRADTPLGCGRGRIGGEARHSSRERHLRAGLEDSRPPGRAAFSILLGRKRPTDAHAPPSVCPITSARRWSRLAFGLTAKGVIHDGVAHRTDCPLVPATLPVGAVLVSTGGVYRAGVVPTRLCLRAALRDVARARGGALGHRRPGRPVE